MIVEIIKVLFVVGGGIIAALFVLAAWRVALADRDLYAQNQRHIKSYRDVLKGHLQVRSYHGGVCDNGVAAGLAYDRTAKRFVEQGRISDDALLDILN